MKKILKQEKRQRRHKRIRTGMSGTAKSPRLCIFRSQNHIYAQLIDDEKGKTLISVNDVGVKSPKASVKVFEDGKENIVKTRKALIAFEVGKLLAEKAIKEKIEKVVFDRGGYQYHGRVKALADGAREGGLKF
jgi:large subunit ribosomal protein L18